MQLPAREPEVDDDEFGEKHGPAADPHLGVGQYFDGTHEHVATLRAVSSRSRT